jgi:hypothetical protein
LKRSARQLTAMMIAMNPIEANSSTMLMLADELF